MKKSLSRLLYLIGLGIDVIAGILLGISLIGSSIPTDNSMGSIGNPVLFGVAILVLAVASIVFIVSWIGALVKMAQLSHWGWFICLFFFSGIAMLVYIFAGPETPVVPQGMAMQYGGYNGQQYQQQQYPPQAYGQQYQQQYSQQPYEQRPE